MSWILDLLYVLLSVRFRTEAQQCTISCVMVTMADGYVPTRFNQCSCSSVDNIDNSTNDSPCVTHFRSLKFRNSTSGTVMIHKAVVKSCESKDIRLLADQSEFDAEEKQFHRTRSVLQRMEKIEKGYSDWVFGFRTNLMSFYNVHDQHLRFGKK